MNLYAGSSNIDDVAWCDENNDPYGVKEVGTKAPNSLGIYDMSGNVYEWCFDSYGPYSNQAVTNPTGADSGFIYVLRGGGWSDSADQCRVSHRAHQGPYVNDGNVGFHLVRKAE